MAAAAVEAFQLCRFICISLGNCNSVGSRQAHSIRPMRPEGESPRMERERGAGDWNYIEAKEEEGEVGRGGGKKEENEERGRREKIKGKEYKELYLNGNKNRPVGLTRHEVKLTWLFMVFYLGFGITILFFV